MVGRGERNHYYSAFYFRYLAGYALLVIYDCGMYTIQAANNLVLSDKAKERVLAIEKKMKVE